MTRGGKRGEEKRGESEGSGVVRSEARSCVPIGVKCACVCVRVWVRGVARGGDSSRGRSGIRNYGGANAI